MNMIKSLLLTAAVALALQVHGQTATNQAAAPRSEADLVKVLNSTGTQKEKTDACRELAIVGGRSSIPALVALLPDPAMSHAARNALQQMPGSQVDRALRDALPTLQGLPLAGVIHSLGERKDVKADKALAAYVDHADPTVARAAALALGRVGGRSAGEMMLAKMKVADAARRPWLAEGVLRCADALLAAGREKPAGELFDALYDVEAPHQVKTAALRGSVLARGQRGPAFLATFLNSPDYATFSSALRIARSLPSLAMSTVLLETMNKAQGEHLLLLMQAVGARRDKAAVFSLAKLLQDPQVDVAKGALGALAQIGAPESAAVLSSLVIHTNAEVRAGAREALASLPGHQADEEILRLADRTESEARIAALDLIVRRRMTEALPKVLELTRSSDEDVRLTAIRRAGELAGPTGGPELLKLLLQAKTNEELAAAEQGLSASLVKASDRDQAASLVWGAWSIASPGQKMVLLNVLSSIGGPRALEAVRQVVAGQHGELRIAAIRALGAWDSVEGATDLLRVAQSSGDGAERVLSLRSYLNLVNEPGLKPDAKMEMIRQAAGLVNSPDETKLLLATLGGISTLPSLTMAQAYLQQPEVKEEAVSAILRIAEKMLQARSVDKPTESIDEALKAAAAATANPTLKDRALKLQEVGKTKATTN